MPASGRILGVPNFSDVAAVIAQKYDSTTVTQVLFIAVEQAYLTQLNYRITVASTSGTATFYKVPSGTAVGSGIALTGAVDLSATPALNTVFNITLLQNAVVSGLGVPLNPGDSIGIVIAGTMTGGIGLLQAFIEPYS